MSTPLSRLRPCLYRLGSLALLALSLVTWGCGERESRNPPSLDGPTALDVAQRDQCGTASPAFRQFRRPRESCDIGLIANTNGERLALADMSGQTPRLVDVDRGTPSITHLRVEGRPIDVAASPDGSAAHVLRSVAGDIAVVDLWRVQQAERTLSLPGTPKTLVTRSVGDEGRRLIAGLHDPNALWMHPPVTCRNPEEGEPGCTGFEADPTRVSLPGRVAHLELGPRQRRLYVTYSDRAFMSVVALSSDVSLDDRGLTCRGGRAAPPCEVERVGLTTGCDDGIDNDGDGLIDQEDPQCYGPDGRESPEGIGRTVSGPCNDGIDNDGDGDVDREDSECQSPAQPSESEPLVDTSVETICSDGDDNDDDGDVDFPDDSACYGEQGATERATPPAGGGSVAAGPMGRFVYVADPNGNQVMTIDAERLSLIDTARATTPPTAPFRETLGITVGDRPVSVIGTVDRNIVWTDPEDASHGIVRHRYGVVAVAGDGRLYRADAIESYCEVTERDRDELLSNDEFQLGGESLADAEERHCLSLPAFPTQSDDAEMDDDPCEAAEACRTCLEAAESDDMGSASACRDVCSDFQGQREACRVQGRELTPSETTRLTINPRFALRDLDSSSGEISATGNCNEPNAYLQSLRDLVDTNPDAPASFGCFSPLRPQPISRFASSEELQQDSFESLSRADLLTRTDLVLEPPSDDGAGEGGEVRATTVSTSDDRRYRSENWRVVYEGVIPGSRRDDGLLARRDDATADDGDTTTSDMTIGGLDLCRAGVRAGDRLEIRTEPRRGDEAPETCRAFRDQERIFEITDVKPRSVTLTPLDDTEDDPNPGSDARDDNDAFPARPPVRECFPRGIEIEIRPHDEWIVVGSQSGFISSRTSEMGMCVPRFGSESRRQSSRVETGDVFTGPYLEFRLVEGSVAPTRTDDAAFEYQLRTRRAFRPSRNAIGTSFPSEAAIFRSLPGGGKLMVSDASNDSIFVQNLRVGSNSVLR